MKVHWRGVTMRGHFSLRLCSPWLKSVFPFELELELVQSQMAQKPMNAVGCSGRANVARAVSVEGGGMGERGCARRLGEGVWV